MGGPDGGGGPPPVETGAPQAPIPEPKETLGPEVKPLSPEVAARKQDVINVLGSPRFDAFKDHEDFSEIHKSFVEELKASVDPATTIAATIGLPEVEIDASYEASTEFGSADARFLETYLPSFNTHATIGDNIENVSVYNFLELMKNPDIKKVQQEEEGKIPETSGTAVVVDSAGKPLYLVAETNTPGVRIVLKGTSILIPDHPGSRMKLSLLVDLKDSKAEEQISRMEEEKDLLTTVQEFKEERAQEVAQITDTDLNNRIEEFRNSIEQLVTDPQQKEFFTNLVEGLRTRDKNQITPEQLQLIDMAIGNSVTTKKERMRLRGILGIIIAATLGIGKDAFGATGLTRMPQQGR